MCSEEEFPGKRMITALTGLSAFVQNVKIKCG
jgi:hypothetical protein